MALEDDRRVLTASVKDAGGLASGALSLGRIVVEAVDEAEMELDPVRMALVDSVNVEDRVEDGKSAAGVAVGIGAMADWLESTTGVNSVDQTANLKGPPQERVLLPT